jgi:hypothetical protein
MNGQGTSVPQTSSSLHQHGSNERTPSVDAYTKNKENFNNSLSKIFFNSPRYQAKPKEGEVQAAATENSLTLRNANGGA